jgi:hypothetical protein
MVKTLGKLAETSGKGAMLPRYSAESASNERLKIVCEIGPKFPADPVARFIASVVPSE